MAKDVEIKFKATDNFSKSVNSMKNSITGLNIALEDYKKLQSEVLGKRIQINFDVTQAKGNVRSLSGDILVLSTQSEKAAKNTQKALEDTTRAAKEAHKAQDQLQKDVQNTGMNTMVANNTNPNNTNSSSVNTAADGNNNNGNTAKKKSMDAATKDLLKGESGKKLVQAVGNNISQEITSMYGNTKGKNIVNVAGGAIDGAAAGFSAGGLGGAAVGAAIGGLTGAINSLTEAQKKSDDAFKSETKTMYDSVKKKDEKNLQDGVSLAAKADTEEKKEQGKEDESYEAIKKSLDDTWDDINKARGEGYIEERKKGMEKEKEMLDNGLAEKLKKAQKEMGIVDAALENKKNEARLNSLNELVNDPKSGFQDALDKHDGIALNGLVSQSEVKGEVDFKNSKEYQAKQEADRQVIQGIQDTIVENGDYIEQGKKVEEQFELGWSGAIESAKERGAFTIEVETRAVNEHGSILQQIRQSINMTKEANEDPKKGRMDPRGMRRYATGLRRVPKDDYPAFLHEGERVLTKVEADKQDKAISGFNIAKLADSIVVREEADIDRIIDGLYLRFKKYAVNTGGVC